jgi:hypothetical protein
MRPRRREASGIVRKIDSDGERKATFAAPLSKARRIRRQYQKRRGPKLCSWHAPETECIGKGKAHKPYEFGCKVSITTTNRRAEGCQFVLHAKALRGNPYTGHTLAAVIEETQALTRREVERVYVDKGYRGCAKRLARVPLRPVRHQARTPPAIGEPGKDGMAKAANRNNSLIAKTMRTANGGVQKTK